MEELVLEENTLKYRRPDIEGGFIYDREEIEYYRATQRNDVLDNFLLGDFNMVGAYVINNAIVEELIKMKKVYTEAYSKSLFCDSLKQIGNDKLHFCLNILKDTPKKMQVTVSFEILETIDRANGYYKNTNTCLIDSRVFQDSPTVQDKIFKFYNIISEKDAGEAKVETDYEVNHILSRQKELLRLKKMCQPTSLRLEKELFDKRIKLLSSSIKSRTILEEFNKQVFYIKDTLLDKKNPLYYRHLNQILDGIFQQYGYELAQEKSLLKSLSKVQSEYTSKQFKQEAIRLSEIARHDDKERKDYFKKQEKIVSKKEQPQKQESKKAEAKKVAEKVEAPASTSGGTSKPEKQKKNLFASIGEEIEDLEEEKSNKNQSKEKKVSKEFGNELNTLEEEKDLENNLLQ